jgi:hypothetical protein
MNTAAAATLATLSCNSSAGASSTTAARGLSAGRGRGSVAHARGVAAGLVVGGRGVAAGFQASDVAVGTARGRGAAAAFTAASGPGTATAGHGRGGVIASASEAAPVGATLSQSTAAGGRGRSCSGGAGTVARGRGGTVLGAAGGTAHWGVVNYSSNEIDALMQCIRRVLPIGNDQWELVSELHSMNYTTNPWNAESIWRKFYSLANQQPGSGDRTLPPMVALVKQIRAAMNVKAGVTDADVSDFFDDDKVEAEGEAEGEAEAVAEGGGEQQGAGLDNQQLLANNQTPVVPTIVTTTQRRSSAGSSHNGQLSSNIAASVQSSKARIRQNQLISSIEALSNASSNAFETLLQQRQLSEDLEWRQHRLDREEERARREADRLRREEELHEMHRKES